jgi:hypothetical protein
LYVDGVSDKNLLRVCVLDFASFVIGKDALETRRAIAVVLGRLATRIDPLDTVGIAETTAVGTTKAGFSISNGGVAPLMTASTPTTSVFLTPG